MLFKPRAICTALCVLSSFDRSFEEPNKSCRAQSSVTDLQGKVAHLSQLNIVVVFSTG